MATVSSNIGLYLGLIATWALAALTALIRIAYLMGTVSSRLRDLERRADAWDEAISNGYRPRPTETR